jgi:hypothetical protein
MKQAKCCGKDCKIKEACGKYIPLIYSDSIGSNPHLYFIFAEFNGETCRNFEVVERLRGLSKQELKKLLMKMCEVKE